MAASLHLVLRRRRRLVDHEHVHGRARRFELQSELLLHRREDRRRVADGRWLWYWWAIRRTGVARELQRDVEVVGNAGPVHDWPADLARQHARKHRERDGVSQQPPGPAAKGARWSPRWPCCAWGRRRELAHRGSAVRVHLRQTTTEPLVGSRHGQRIHRTLADFVVSPQREAVREHGADHREERTREPVAIVEYGTVFGLDLQVEPLGVDP